MKTEFVNDVHVLGDWRVSLSAWHFWRSSEGAESVAADALRRAMARKRLDAYTVPCGHAGSGGRPILRPVVRDVRRKSRGHDALKIVMRADKNDRVAAAWTVIAP